MSDQALIVGVRLGEVHASGAYFSLPGSSTYFDPQEANRNCYDLSMVRILDWRDPLMAMALLLKTRELATEDNSTPRGAELLADAIAEVEAGEPAHVNYFLADETPMAEATKTLGYGALMVFEADDWVEPSSLFVTDAAISNVRKLTMREKTAFLNTLDLVPNSAANEVTKKTPYLGR